MSFTKIKLTTKKTKDDLCGLCCTYWINELQKQFDHHNKHNLITSIITTNHNWSIDTNISEPNHHKKHEQVWNTFSNRITATDHLHISISLSLLLDPWLTSCFSVPEEEAGRREDTQPSWLWTWRGHMKHTPSGLWTNETVSLVGHMSSAQSVSHDI